MAGPKKKSKRNSTKARGTRLSTASRRLQHKQVDEANAALQTVRSVESSGTPSFAPIVDTLDDRYKRALLFTLVSVSTGEMTVDQGLDHLRKMFYPVSLSQAKMLVAELNPNWLSFRELTSLIVELDAWIKEPEEESTSTSS